MTPREELEAAIWRAWPDMEAILAAVDAYASVDSPVITAARREVLHRERTDIGRQR